MEDPCQDYGCSSECATLLSDEMVNHHLIQCDIPQPATKLGTKDFGSVAQSTYTRHTIQVILIIFHQHPACNLTSIIPPIPRTSSLHATSSLPRTADVCAETGSDAPTLSITTWITPTHMEEFAVSKGPIHIGTKTLLRPI